VAGGRPAADFAVDRHLTGAQVTAAGAFERAVVGWFDRDEVPAELRKTHRAHIGIALIDLGAGEAS
jgi:hypothetical protein